MRKLAVLFLLPLLLCAEETKAPFRFGFGGQAGNWGYGGSVRSWIRNRIAVEIQFLRDWDGIEERGHFDIMSNFAPKHSFAPYLLVGGGLTQVDLPEVGTGRNNGYLGHARFGAGGELFMGRKRHGISLDATYNLGTLEYTSRATTGIGSSSTEQIKKKVSVDPFTINLAYHFYLIAKAQKEEKTIHRITLPDCDENEDTFSWFDENDSCGEADRDGDGISNSLDKCPYEKEDVDGFEDHDGCPEDDNDRDGIKDSLDKCPDKAEDRDGFFDDDGCPETDYDGDGIRDIADFCPSKKETQNGFKDEDGCPERDIDTDGIVDALDRCPHRPEDMDGFRDEDGCPEDDDSLHMDSDGDGVVNSKDRCPNEAETENFLQDEDGCFDTLLVPDSLRLGGVVGTVHFALNRYTLTKSTELTLDTVVALLKQEVERGVLLEGYTDNLGSHFFNRRISFKRAKVVKAYLVKNGISPKRISTVGLGNTKTKYPNDTEEGRAKNRRVEIVLQE